MVGQTISHYRITDRLGAGGMGVVYKAQDLQLQRTVALKFLPSDVAVTERDKESLLREARSASALDHPNTGVIYGLEETADHQLYIVMGFYEGQTLAQKLSRGPLPANEALDLAIQIARGLSAAHARNIVHRDIKPSNIIITTDGLVKIVDFGLARVVASSSATQTLLASGTLPYMAPEQVLAESVDQRSDVWALGVILVQMLTGSHPFLRENSAAMTFAILNQPPAALDVMPALLQPIAYRALSKKPEFRYATAKKMLVDLESAKLQITSRSAERLQEGATLSETIPARDLKQIAERASTPRWPTAAPRKAASRKLLYAGIFVAVVALASLLVPQVRERLAGFLVGGSENHIAVLPFDNIGNDPANEAVAEGLMDSLTSKLSNLDLPQRSLWVVPASVVRNRKTSDPGAAARDLGANLVVKGSIRRDARNVQLTVNLIDAKNLRQIGSAVLDDATGDLASLQDEAVARLARIMKINVTADMLRATGGRASPAAYESYLKALGYMQRYDKPGNLDQAVDALNEAVKTDPQFALGYASLGEAYRLKNQLDPNPRWIDVATADLERAVQLDNRLAATYVSLGRLHSSLSKHDLALQEFQKALAINPRDADAIKGMAGAYERMGRIQDAEDGYKRAIALRPDYWDGYNALGFFYYQQKRYSEAISQYEHVIQLTPDNLTAHNNLGGMLQNTGDYQKAEEEFRKSLAIGPSYMAYANLGSLYETQKRYAEAAQMTEKALQINSNDFRLWANLDLAYEWLNQKDRAATAKDKELALLEELVKNQPGDAGLHSALAVLYASKNEREKAFSNVRTALALTPEDSGVLSDVAEAYEDLGDRKQALKYAEESLKKGYPLEYFKNHPAMQELLADPNFRAPGK